MTRHRRTTSVLSAATVVAGLFIATGAGAPPADAAASTPKTLVIGVDGATYAAMQEQDLPAIESLQGDGTTSLSQLYAEPMAPTLSGPGWASIATGTWPDQHGVRDNEFTGARFDEHPDYLSRLERADSDVSTLALATWSPIVDTVFGSDVDDRTAGDDDADTTARAVDALSSGGPDSTFVQLDDVDHAGHDHGTDSAEYGEQLRQADERIGEIVDAVESRSTYADEDWLIMVTADHGHTAAGGHGGASLPERTTFVIARGAGGTPGTVDHAASLVDVAPTVLAHHGVSLPADLDGRPLGDLEPDDFDSLRPALRDAVDEEPGEPGWTADAPGGWSIDNSAMPGGGVTEWRGWSFSTQAFWSDVDTGQGRETNVRSRDVFAVADSDEWDDAAHDDGPFDSTLVSPDYDVDGAGQATVRFASTYAVDGPQTAQVLVGFDGADAEEVLSYSAPVNRVEQVDVDVPSGAETMQVRFRYTGENSAFWTVDQVTVAAD